MCLCASLTACHSGKDSGTKAMHNNNTTSAISDVKINDLKPVSEDYKFPEVHISGHAAIEEKINTVLQLDLLEHLPGVFKKDPFETVMPQQDNYSGTTSIYGWKQLRTNPNVLSLSVDGEATGAYSEGFTTYYNFDLRNGDRITLKDLFTEEGLKSITKELNQHVKKELEDFIASAKNNAASQKQSDEDRENTEEQIAMYEDCLSGALDYEAGYYSFYFSNDSLVFERGRCSNHAMQALDDLDRFDIPMAVTALEDYMTPYGKGLIAGNDGPGSSSPEWKLYKGSINGQYPIRAIIKEVNDDGSLSMSYWYEKKRIPIEWSGTFKGQHFSLKEAGGDAETATVEADWKEGKITGTWTNIKTKKQMTLTLETYQ